jgi:hypothetical protein
VAPAALSLALRETLQNAKDTELEFGKGRLEAIAAWFDLEETASSGLDNAMGMQLDDG